MTRTLTEEQYCARRSALITGDILAQGALKQAINEHNASGQVLYAEWRLEITEARALAKRAFDTACDNHYKLKS